MDLLRELGKWERFVPARRPASAAMLAIIGLALLAAPSLVHAEGGSSLTGNLELRKGDHISLIGNTLADRMQHDGWLETLPPGRFPDHDLVDPQPRLLRRRADDPAPLGRLRHARRVADRAPRPTSSSPSSATTSRSRQRASTSSSTTSTASSSTRSRRSTTARRAPARPLLADRPREPARPHPARRQGEQRAARAATPRPWPRSPRPTASRSSTSSTRRKELYAEAAKPLTINGIHLTADGNRMLAEIIDEALFPERAGVKRDAAALEKLRQAVLDKNFYWFNRYRTVDGYSIYGGRADLQFVGGQTNRVVDAARDGSPRRDDRQPRPADLGRRAGRGPEGRRQQHAAVHPGR